MSRRMPSRKRARTAGKQSAAERAMFASMYASRKYPYSSYGRQYIPKGHFLKEAGRSYAAATPAQRAWRRANNYHGVGMYTGGGMYTGQGNFWKSLGRGIRKLGKSKFIRGIRHDLSKELGAAAEELLPGSGGAAEAALKAAGIGMYTGQGGYQTVKNELIHGGHASEGLMRFDAQNDEDAVMISHSEYVMDVYAPPGTEKKVDIKLPLNAGEAKTFPMLSQLAANFEDFEVVQLAFTYKPTLSDWQTTSGQVGQILMATNYNPSADKWTTKQQLLAQTGSTSARTIDATFHGVECDTSKIHNDGHYLVRTGPPRPEQDLKDFDHGWTQISVVDTPAEAANKTLGELHVSYTIKLSKPRIWAGVANNLPSFKAVCSSASNAMPTNGPFDKNIFGFSAGSRGYIIPTESFNDKYTARQGSLECALRVGTEPASSLLVNQIVFPAGFAGDVCVRITADIFNSSTITSDFPMLVARTSGQCDSIKDQPIFFGSDDVREVQTVTLHGLENASAGTGGGETWFSPPIQSAATIEDTTTIVTELHLRLNVARDQVDNIFHFMFAGTLGSASLARWHIDINAYNTRLNYRQDGANDKVILEDKAGQIVTY
jgi:hypothetical protein